MGDGDDFVNREDYHKNTPQQGNKTLRRGGERFSIKAEESVPKRTPGETGQERKKKHRKQLVKKEKRGNGTQQKIGAPAQHRVQFSAKHQGQTDDRQGRPCWRELITALLEEEDEKETNIENSDKQG